MRILLYGINYAPELTGIGKYSGEMSAWLAQNGHQVEVITAVPYYPEWQVHDQYRKKGWSTEWLDGVRVHRCPLYVPQHVTALKRIIHEFSFVASSLPYWLKALFGKRPDVVICVVPAFHLGFLALLYARLRRLPMVYHIQDLQVDAAKDLGMLTNQTFLKLLFSAEQFILNHSTTVSTISEGMLRKIWRKGIDPQKCLLFPNWVDESQIRPLSQAASLRSAFGLADTDQVILYSGSLGEKQGLDLIIEAARRLQHRPNLVFLIVGSGGAEGRLKDLVRDYQLTNVRFFPLQPYEKLSVMLAAADLHLVVQKKSASDLVMPSKLTSILAAGGCALVTALPDTSLHDVVVQHQLGIVVEPESVEAMCAGIEQAIGSDLDHYRQNARAYAEQYLRKDSILASFATRLGQIAALKPVAEKQSEVITPAAQ